MKQDDDASNSHLLERLRKAQKGASELLNMYLDVVPGDIHKGASARDRIEKMTVGQFANMRLATLTQFADVGNNRINSLLRNAQSLRSDDFGSSTNPAFVVTPVQVSVAGQNKPIEIGETLALSQEAVEANNALELSITSAPLRAQKTQSTSETASILQKTSLAQALYPWHLPLLRDLVQAACFELPKDGTPDKIALNSFVESTEAILESHFREQCQAFISKLNFLNLDNPVGSAVKKTLYITDLYDLTPDDFKQFAKHSLMDAVPNFLDKLSQDNNPTVQAWVANNREGITLANLALLKDEKSQAIHAR